LITKRQLCYTLLLDNCPLVGYNKNNNRFTVDILTKIHVRQVMISQPRRDKHSCLLEGNLMI